MPDYISRQRLKKKVLDRWENEGGKILADQTGIIERGSADEGSGKDAPSPAIDNVTQPEREREPEPDNNIGGKNE